MPKFTIHIRARAIVDSSFEVEARDEKEAKEKVDDLEWDTYDFYIKELWDEQILEIEKRD